MLTAYATSIFGIGQNIDNEYVSLIYLVLQSQTTTVHHFYCGKTAHRNGLIFVRSSSAFEKELIAHFSAFFI